MALTKQRRLAVIVGVGAMVAAGLAAAPAFASTANDVPRTAAPTGRSNVAATTVSGHPLAAGATLRPGERMVVVVRGFAPSAPVQVLLQSGVAVVAVQSAEADPAGSARVAFSVPATITPGPHVLAVTGPGPSPETTSSDALPNVGSTITVTAPNVGLYPFTIATPRRGARAARPTDVRLQGDRYR
jgi:hypothetical protein